MRQRRFYQCLTHFVATVTIHCKEESEWRSKQRDILLQNVASVWQTLVMDLMKNIRLHGGCLVHAYMLLDNVVLINYKVNWVLKILLKKFSLFRPTMQAAVHSKWKPSYHEAFFHFNVGGCLRLAAVGPKSDCGKISVPREKLKNLNWAKLGFCWYSFPSQIAFAKSSRKYKFHLFFCATFSSFAQ